MAIQYKQQQAELIRAVSEVEAALASKGKVIHIMSKPGMTQEQMEQASANRALIEAHLFQKFRTDGLIDATFDSLWRTVVSLYKGGSIKAESDAAKESKPVLVSNSGRVNHAHKAALDEDSPLKHQANAQEIAEGQRKATEIWSQCEAVIQSHRHYRNHAVTRRDQHEMLELMKALYVEGSPAQAYDALIKIKDLSRRLGDKHQ